MHIGLFENFYPGKDRLGTHSTSLSLLLQRATAPTTELDLAVPEGSRWPAPFRSDRVRFHPSWRHGDAGSLVRAARALSRRVGRQGRVLFNWFPTCFGETRAVNAVGMLLPSIVRASTRRAPCVSAPNFLATQPIGRLGYTPRRIERIGVGAFERALTRSSRVIVPLESQRSAIESLFGGSVVTRAIPFAEAIFGHWAASVPSPRDRNGTGIATGRPFRILLFGVWGPAKDITSVLPVLARLYRDGHDFETVFAGSFNRFFPAWRSRLSEAVRQLPEGRCRFVPDPPDESTPELFGGSDLVILPYHAIAGPSGVMGLAAFHGCAIVAYDVAELREYDAILRGRTTFVPSRTPDALHAAIEQGLSRRLPRSTEPKEDKVLRSLAAAERLATYLAEA